MAKNTSPKTNAMRALDQRKIIYRAVSYSPEIHSATEVAEILEAPPNHVYKTLVVLPESGQGRPMLVMVPGSKELDLKVFGASTGEKKVRMATQREAENLTGLLVGGISAPALLQKGFRVFIDEEALRLDQIYVSAGQRGINLQLARADLIKITEATPVKVT
jgi:Cys-tRNA(Pro)/Cys-tRNA(Cys) deacylase